MGVAIPRVRLAGFCPVTWGKKKKARGVAYGRRIEHPRGKKCNRWDCCCYCREGLGLSECSLVPVDDPGFNQDEIRSFSFQGVTTGLKARISTLVWHRR